MQKICGKDIITEKKKQPELTDEERAGLRARYHDRIQSLTLMDDEFMVKVFENDRKCTGLVLQIILGRKLRVKSVRGQKLLENLQGHSVRLDIAAVDEDGVNYDIEIQRSDRGAAARRARFYSGIIDANELVKQEDYGRLPESYVIFITENDVLRKGLPVYHIERVIAETGDSFNDGSHIIYVNAEKDGDGTRLSRLMHDFKCRDPGEMNYRTLGKKAGRYKSPTKEEHMCRVFEEVKLEGAKEKAIETARNGISMGLSSVQIGSLTGLSVEEVEALKRDASGSDSMKTETDA